MCKVLLIESRLRKLTLIAKKIRMFKSRFLVINKQVNVQVCIWNFGFTEQFKLIKKTQLSVLDLLDLNSMNFYKEFNIFRYIESQKFIN